MGLFYFFMTILILHQIIVSAAGKTNQSDLISPSEAKQNLPHSFEKMDSLPNSHTEKYTRGHRATSSQRHTVTFAIKKLNMDQLQANLDDISNPFSVNYGNYKTREELNAITANHEGSSKLLHALRHHSVGEDTVEVLSVTPNQDYITARASVQLWENFLNTEFYFFERKADTKSRSKSSNRAKTGVLIRAMEYALHSELAEHILCVFNVVDVPIDLRTSVSMDTGPTDAELADITTTSSGGVIVPKYVTPALLNKVYSIDSNVGSTKVSQGVYETSNQSFSPSDLATFQAFMGLPNQPVATVIGGHSSDKACADPIKGFDNCGEGNFDVQYMMAVSQVTPMTYYYIDESDATFMIDWLTAMASSSNPPKVMSVSWGGADYYFPQKHVTAANNEAIILSTMGVTLVASSGDDGASAISDQCGYMTLFPASSPYFTAVGATNGPQLNLSETACQSNKNNGVITSGGGMSVRTNSTPAWQEQHVNKYFSSFSCSLAPGYATQGRGMPDISLMGADYYFYVNKEKRTFFGTSTSAPVFAGMVSLVNAARAAVGKSTLGWINPALYALSSKFVNDITVGDNYCQNIESGPLCCAQGYKASVGWDPVTGLGSVNFTRFKNAFLNLPSGSEVSPSTTAVPTGYSTPSNFLKKPTSRPAAKKPTSRPVTKKPTSRPVTKKPTSLPTVKMPTSLPTSHNPTSVPTTRPLSRSPSVNIKPSSRPGVISSGKPSRRAAPETTMRPTANPPTILPTARTGTPTMMPSTASPTLKPTMKPNSKKPSRKSTKRPTGCPTSIRPSFGSSVCPSSIQPSAKPTITPTVLPTSKTPTMKVVPTVLPTSKPKTPTVRPSVCFPSINSKSTKPVAVAATKPTTKPTHKRVATH
eukprot:gene28582-37547_t